MTTIWDRAVRALQPVCGETGNRGVDAGHPLAYYCGGPNLVCRHKTCAAVSALAEADLLAYADTPQPVGGTTVTEWAIEWADVPPDDPDRIEPRTDEAIARKWAGYWSASGTPARAVSRTVTYGPWEAACG